MVGSPSSRGPAPSSPSDAERRTLRRHAGLGALAFVWTFACGVVWIATGARNEPDGFFTSVLCGFVAVLPGVLTAAWLVVAAGLRLLRGRPASALSVTLAAGTLFGGLLMNQMVWSLWLDRLFPQYYAHGRRLRRGRALLAPAATSGHGWLRPTLDAIDVPAPYRTVLAAQWRENGSKEHASVAAFAQLTLDLLAVGAPAALVEAAQRDAGDEVRHAELCYAVARAIDGEACSPAPFPAARERRELPPVREVALAQLAIDALSDGVLNEGIAARILARLARDADPTLREVLRAMAVDEARHARDSWDVLAWCLAEGGALVHAMLVRARADVPATLGSPLPALAEGGALRPWGVQDPALERREYAIVRRQTLARLDTLLARTAGRDAA